MAPRNPPSVQDEAEQLLRDVARDGVAAARIGWRIANRVGHAGLRMAEHVADEALDELEKHRPRRGGGVK